MESMNERGFSQIIPLGIVVVLILAGVSWFWVSQEKKTLYLGNNPQQDVSLHKTEEITRSTAVENKVSPTNPIFSKMPHAEPTVVPSSKSNLSTPTKASPASPTADDTLAFIPSCGDKKDFFSALPVNLSDLVFIRPLGFIGAAPEHIYPTDHIYFSLEMMVRQSAIPLRFLYILREMSGLRE